MTKSNIGHKRASISDFLVTSLPSILKNLSSFIINWLLRLNQVGTNQYIAISGNIAKNRINTLSISKTNDKTEISPTPVARDLRITFLSLLKKLFIFFIIFLKNQGINLLRSFIIPQKQELVTVFMSIMMYFSVISTSHAKQECLSAISKYEQLYKIPNGLLKAISKVESDYNPHALNDGLGRNKFSTKQEVIDRANFLIEIGKSNFDLGCMQINYRWHAKNFSSVDDMLDVSSNVRYAAALIHGLYKEHGNWQAAIRHYHSYEPRFYKKYSKKIALAWLEEES